MRAIAVLLVVLYHAGVPFLPGGFVGVDVFFVLSGFLITGIMVSEIDRTQRFRLSRFYAKRILRIIPAATLVLVATGIATVLWVPITQWKSIASELAGSAIYVVNWQLAATTNYLNAESLPSPMQHFWSLAVEEQFYILWPALILLVLWLVGRKRNTQTYLTLRILSFVIAIVVILSFLFSLVALQKWPAPAFFITPTRIWELGIGALLAFALPNVRRFPRRLKRALTVVGSVAVIASAIFFSAATAFPGASALLPTFGTAAMIAGGTPVEGEARTYPVLGHPVAVWFGNISYALYLWHWPVLIIATAHFFELELIWKLALAGVAVVLAEVSTRYFEKPLRSSKILKKTVPRAYMLGAGAIILSIALAVGIGGAVTAKINTPPDPNVLGALSLSEGTIPPKVSAPLPTNLSPNVLNAPDDNSRINKDGCHLEPADIELRPCGYGSGPTVLLVGDSHAAHWFPALELLAEEQGFRLEAMTKSSCPLTDLPLKLTSRERLYGECIDWNKRVTEYIAAEQPALVVTSSLEIYTSAESETSNPMSLEEGYRLNWDKVSSIGIPLLVLADTPYMSSNVPDCLAQFGSQPELCRTSRDKAYALAGALEKAAADVPGATFINLNDKVCPGAYCEPIIGDVIVYRDQHHLTATFARTLAATLEERAGDLLPENS